MPGAQRFREGYTGAVWQLVGRLHRDRAQVLEGFDLAPCKALARIAPDGALVVEALPSWVEAMRASSPARAHPVPALGPSARLTPFPPPSAGTRAFAIDTSVWSESTISRTYKYIAKGFDCMVPGTVRAAFLPITAELRHNDVTIRGLFEAELYAIKVRTNWRQPRPWMRRPLPFASKDAPLTPIEARIIARRVGFASDYETGAEMSGVLEHIVRSLVHSIKSLFRGRRAERAVSYAGPRVWLDVDSTPHARSAAKKLLYDFAKLAARGPGAE